MLVRKLFLSVALVFGLAGIAQGAAIGINFGETDSNGDIWGGNKVTASENTATLDGLTGTGAPSWTNFPADINSGTGSGMAGALSVSYDSTNTYHAGQEGIVGTDDASQQPFRAYLDDGDGTNADGYGATVTLSGLSAWLTSVGATSYEITLLRSTDHVVDFFTAVDVLDGSLTLINTHAPVAPLGLSTYPTADTGSGDGNGVRAFSQMAGYTADVITIAALKNPEDGNLTRGPISGVIISTVPEPATLSMLLGSMAMLLSTRRKR